MNTFTSWLLILLSRMLEPAEREAVQGDLAESGETSGKALRQLLGLVARRQAALWKDWRPWASLLGLIVPLSFLLSVVARNTASENATYVWLYANNWEWTLLKDGGFWYEFIETLAFVFVRCLTLVCWAWTAGFTIGILSQRMLRVYACLFCIMLTLVPLLVAPPYMNYLLHYLQRPLPSGTNEPVFALSFYREMLRLIIQLFLVAFPFLWGMSQGEKSRMLPALFRTFTSVAATCALSTLVFQEPGIRFFVATAMRANIPKGWPIRLLHLFVYWPLGYLVVRTIWRRWHDSQGQGVRQQES